MGHGGLRFAVRLRERSWVEERGEREMVSRQATDGIGKIRILCVLSDRSSMGLLRLRKG